MKKKSVTVFCCATVMYIVKKVRGHGESILRGHVLKLATCEMSDSRPELGNLVIFKMQGGEICFCPTQVHRTWIYYPT